ncbi:MAG: recombination protein O N-terminal domain-containing protein [Patescibacteria group bacterium]
MREYLSEAIVLDKEPNGDLDVRFSLFTKKFGKLHAKAKSARKITSKLAPHLEPGNLVQVRLVEKNGLQVVDALKKTFLDINLRDLYHLEKILAEGEPDKALWQALIEKRFVWREVLALLGWDPENALCEACEKYNPAYFDTRTQRFLCGNCSDIFFKSSPSQKSERAARNRLVKIT